MIDPYNPQTILRKSVLQDWVLGLPGLRHQGVLLGAVRGCDILPKYGHAKTLTRYLRAMFLNAHCGDPRKAVSFIEVCPSAAHFEVTVKGFFEEYDMLPFHYVMHLAHAVEMVGYYHPKRGGPWLLFYKKICKKLHVNPETKEELDKRLLSDEETFKTQEEVTE